jgi:D-tyrosyl-tRNA(Tyr) deacylase
LRAVIQRVSRAEVRVDGEVVGKVERGAMVLVAVVRGDGKQDLEWMTRKLLGLRFFPDDEGKMNRSVADIGGGLLLVSQFTLAADIGKGTRPSFSKAESPDRANELFEQLVSACRASVPVETGRFAADMKVELINDGPVTLLLDSGARGD